MTSSKLKRQKWNDVIDNVFVNFMHGLNFSVKL